MLALVGLFVGARGDVAPVFVTSLQYNQTFPLAPGQLLNLSETVKIHDADPSGTPQGSISSSANLLQTSLFCLTQTAPTTLVPLSCNFDGFSIQASLSFTEGLTNRSSIDFSMKLQPSGSFETFPSPLVHVCFQARDGLSKTSSFCFNVYLLVPPKPILNNSQCVQLFNSSTWSFEPYQQLVCLIAPLNELSAVGLGQTLERNIYFSCALSYASVNVAVLSNPGLPNGFTIAGMYGGPSDSTNPTSSSNLLEFKYLPDRVLKHQHYVFSRAVSFTPSEDQVGLSFKLCLSAISSYLLPNSSSWPQLSADSCLSVSVVPPSFALNSTDLNLSAAFYHDVLVGCDYVWSITVYEPSRYQQGPATPSLQTDYTPALVSDSHDLLPPSAFFSEGQQLVVCSDRQDRVCADKSYPMTRFELRWTPSRGLEAQTFQSCFWLQERKFSRFNRLRFCANFRVSKCKTCVMRGETLLALARHYRTTWLQLWGANPHLHNPQNLSQLSFLHLGPSFHVSKDTDVTVIMQVDSSFACMSCDFAAEVRHAG